MTVSSQLNRVEYAGNGVTTVFSTSPVAFFDSSDLDVYIVVTATGTATLKTITTHYAVTGGSGAVGTVTMTAAAIPATGEKLLILRVLDLTQTTDFVNNDPSDAEVAEDALDKLTMMAQQLDEEIGRAVLLGVGSASSDITIPEPSALKLLRWNAAGTALENVLVASAVTLAFTVTAFAETLLDDSTAAAARVTLDAQEDVITTKGDVLVGSAAGVAARLATGTERQIMEVSTAASTGLAWATRALGLKSMQTYSTAQTVTWTRPAGVRKVFVEVQGSGGGGGGGSADAAVDSTHFASGGGGGGYVHKFIDVSAISTATVTLGPAGAGGAAGANPGTAGSASSWADGTNTLAAGGGAAGLGAADGSNLGYAGGAGGTASGGDVNIVGGRGQGGGALTTTANLSSIGGGGRSFKGLDNYTLVAIGPQSTTPAVAPGPGVGGGGAMIHENNAAAAGAAGAVGRIIVWEYE